MRDDFTLATKSKLAARVGYRCSCPDCPQVTIGPESGGDGTVNIGKAAHITAASPGGPRYDASLTPEQRRSQSNGIWLCATHADQIDRDERTFTVDVLRKWKIEAEQCAFLALTSGRSTVLLPSAAIDQAVIAALSLDASENVDAVVARLEPAVSAKLPSRGKSAWQRGCVITVPRPLLGQQPPPEARPQIALSSFGTPRIAITRFRL